MKATLVYSIAAALTLAALSTLAWQAMAGGELVKFPETYMEGVHYATVNRGNIREELFTSRAAIDAVKSGQPIPSGTVITMEDYRDQKLFRYVVKEKRAGWCAEYPPEKRNGEWEFQAFNADKSVNRNENLGSAYGFLRIIAASRKRANTSASGTGAACRCHLEEMQTTVEEEHVMITRRCILAGTGGLAALAATGGAGTETPTLIVSTKRRSETMEIKRSGSQPSRKGQAEYFTGAVRIDPLFTAPDPARVSGGSVTFEPGARTAWHTHPLGQTLIVTSGLGRVQREGGPIEEVRAGDVVWFPPGLKHWHGATPTTAMTHIAIQESLNGKNVDWMETVSDEQYPK